MLEIYIKSIHHLKSIEYAFKYEILYFYIEKILILLK